MAENEIKTGEEVLEDARKFAEKMVRASGLFNKEGLTEDVSQQAATLAWQELATTFFQTGFYLIVVNEVIRNSATHSESVGRLALPLKEEDYAISKIVDAYLADVEVRRSIAKAHQEEIDKLGSETRAMIAQLLAA